MVKRNSATKNTGRASPRYRFDKHEAVNVRFASDIQGRISVSRVVDISETGMAFTIPRRLRPVSGEVIKLQFSPSTGVQIACLGKVVRIEEPTENSKWAITPETVKVGVTFYDLPKAYSKIISESINRAFRVRRQGPKEVIDITMSFASTAATDEIDRWLANNWKSFMASVILIMGFIVGVYWMISDPDMPTDQGPTWAGKFFENMRVNKK